MRILVCFAISPVLEELTPDEWQTAVENNLDLSFVKRTYGDFDETALEQGLRLKDSLAVMNQECTLHALTIDAEENTNALSSLFAVGYDSVFRLEIASERWREPQSNARLLADFVDKQGGYDVILMGQQAVGLDSGQTHWMLSELLGIPAVTNVSAIEPVNDGTLSVTHGGVHTRAMAHVSVPIVLGVENCQHTYLRIPTLREKLAAKSKEIAVLSASEEATNTTPPRVWYQRSDRLGCILQGDTVADKVEQLYQLVLKEVLPS